MKSEGTVILIGLELLGKLVSINCHLHTVFLLTELLYTAVADDFLRNAHITMFKYRVLLASFVGYSYLERRKLF